MKTDRLVSVWKVRAVRRHVQRLILMARPADHSGDAVVPVAFYRLSLFFRPCHHPACPSVLSLLQATTESPRTCFFHASVSEVALVGVFDGPSARHHAVPRVLVAPLVRGGPQWSAVVHGPCAAVLIVCGPAAAAAAAER